MHRDGELVAVVGDQLVRHLGLDVLLAALVDTLRVDRRAPVVEPLVAVVGDAQEQILALGGYLLLRHDDPEAFAHGVAGCAEARHVAQVKVPLGAPLTLVLVVEDVEAGGDKVAAQRALVRARVVLE
eukprot:6715691-Prymnesium_polylepis.1